MPSWLSVKPFLDAQATADPGAWTFFGAPFDSTSSFRPGSQPSTLNDLDNPHDSPIITTIGFSGLV